MSVVTALFTSVAGFLVLRATPDHRTAFLIDTSLVKSGNDFAEIADAVGSAAQNSADGDSLSLRRFGGACGDKDNTESIVGAGTGQAQKISASVGALNPSGKPTLESGVLAAIDDFSGYYPLRGSKRNRVIVVTSHGVDACTADQASLKRTIGRKAQDSGVQLELRFVGYKVPRKQQRPLTRLATAVQAPEPRFVTTPRELTRTLNELIIPDSQDAKHIDVPSVTPTSTISTPPSAPLSDGGHKVYIKNVDPKTRTLTIDEIEYLSGAEALEAAREDGHDIDFVPNDIYIRNVEEKTVDLPVASDADIEINNMIGDPTAALQGQQVSMEQLAERFSALDRTHFEPTKKAFELTMTNGRVTKLLEMWRP
ncbi:hypothetical protein ACFS5L_01550 [Streptomyces phyllanthi]|uniref:hypothetical protein n=1 Tax=Streptomyces phyllanthi TaxID=1803180 RepID=UPI0018842711|nr:hypothetical protein [Streptomyces phyllanthi]